MCSCSSASSPCVSPGPGLRAGPGSAGGSEPGPAELCHARLLPGACGTSGTSGASGSPGRRPAGWRPSSLSDGGFLLVLCETEPLCLVSRGLLGCQVPGDQRGRRSVTDVSRVLMTLQRLLLSFSFSFPSSRFSSFFSSSTKSSSLVLPQGEIGRPGLKVSSAPPPLSQTPASPSPGMCPWINRIWTLPASRDVIGAIGAAGGGLSGSR